MIVLQAAEEQEQVFQKLMQTMGEQVVWNGRFLVKDDELILEGTVRSLIFQFETKKVTTNLVDLPYQEQAVLDISRHPTLKDLLNMVLYAFGKWGTLRGLNVQQDYPQLNQLFAKILNTFYIEPSFRKENFRFYKVGVRITYEEVLQTVLEYEKKQAEDPAAESQGLWHRLIWKNRERTFHKEETTLLERVEDRIGNNFYLVGYQCPKCQQKLHMAVYPEGKEVRIDTEEKGVYLARTYTCSHCNCFYTPRPNRLISEGLIYEMDFEEDSKAYEDYLELMGYYGERAANFLYNEYEAVRRQRLLQEAKKEMEPAYPGNSDRLYSPQDALRQMERFGRNISALPEEVFRRFAHRVEEGFYPDAAVEKYERKIIQEVRERDGRKQREEDTPAAVPTPHDEQAVVSHAKPENIAEQATQRSHSIRASADAPHARQVQGTTVTDAQKQTHVSAESEFSKEMEFLKEMELDDLGQASYTESMQTEPFRAEQARTDPAPAKQMSGKRNRTQPLPAETQERTHAAAVPKQAVWHSEYGSSPATHAAGQPAAYANPSEDEHLKQYEKRLQVLERLSPRQKKELKKQIQNDTKLDAAQKQTFVRQMEEAEYVELAEELHKKEEQNKKKSYAQLKKTIQETEKEDYPQAIKEPYLKNLYDLRRQRGTQEVRQIIEQMPERMDRAAFQKLEQRLKTYEEVDLSPYQETLRQKKEAAEKQEIAGMVKRSRKVSRGDYTGLMRRLEEQKFADENVAPYMEKIKEKVTALDQERLNALLDESQQMDFNAAAAVYEQILDENFLPELKNSALEMLAKRLEKIRTDECELLVRKLQDEMRSKIKENTRHHFYPARKVMLNTAEPGETAAIDSALASYANERSMFEYPVFSVDTSRSGSGREGMLLTPETLFYSTRSHAYEIPVSDITSIEASTGLLNRKIMLTEINGAEHKLPYAVKTGEMEDWADILEAFIFYLQEKPASRKLKYLARETHDTICCYRCGYVYQDRDICPECGYKKNR